jgi:hypothetical protein
VKLEEKEDYAILYMGSDDYLRVKMQFGKQKKGALLHKFPIKECEVSIGN